MGYQTFLLKKWTETALKLANDISPLLVRTYNNFIEGHIAIEIKKKLDIPVVTSLHGIWNTDGLSSLKMKILRLFRKKFEFKTLQNADAVICVYSSILDYANRYGNFNSSWIFL